MTNHEKQIIINRAASAQFDEYYSLRLFLNDHPDLNGCKSMKKAKDKLKREKVNYPLYHKHRAVRQELFNLALLLGIDDIYSVTRTDEIIRLKNNIDAYINGDVSEIE